MPPSSRSPRAERFSRRFEPGGIRCPETQGGRGLALRGMVSCAIRPVRSCRKTRVCRCRHFAWMTNRLSLPFAFSRPAVSKGEAWRNGPVRSATTRDLPSHPLDGKPPAAPEGDPGHTANGCFQASVHTPKLVPESIRSAHSQNPDAFCGRGKAGVRCGV